jgi:hypothetical protein
LLFGRDPICNLIAGFGREIYKSDAYIFFRFRYPHNLRGDFNPVLHVGQSKANLGEVVGYYERIGRSNGHARLTYIEDNATIDVVERGVRAGGKRGA